MRLAILSDVHANLQALEAALAAAERLGAEAVACPGDLVGYGPDPNRCVRLTLREAGATVAGNHDLIAIGRLADDRCIPLARRSLAWTRDALEDDAREALGALPLTAEPAPGVLMAHGTPADPQEYVHTAEHALACLAGLEGDARLLVVGHTHRWMAVSERRGPLPVGPGSRVALEAGDRMLLNPGSVGQSRERRARARFALLDLAAGTADFHEVGYDVRATRRSLARAGLPRRSVHLRPSRARRLAGRARDAVRGARR